MDHDMTPAVPTTTRIPERAPDETRQRTLAGTAHCVGVGLHSGCRVRMTLHPARENQGVRFVRSDVLGRRALIGARWCNVDETPLCTVLRNDSAVAVATVEHVLAALRLAGIDNATVEVNGPEVPILDGSAAPFMQMISMAGTCAQPAPRRLLLLRQALSLRMGPRVARLVPSRAPRFSVLIDFPHPVVGRQHVSFGGDDLRSVADARTFGFERDLSRLRARHLALGASVRNAVVITDEGVRNVEGLRHADEFARHKVLDCIGDLSLADGWLRADFYGHRPGHALTVALLRALHARPDAWSCLPADEAVGAAARADSHLLSGARGKSAPP
jgi:UDP-3-O-[3-hydroxymyristoyl] N-acetylglucosamine deacetylase